MFILGFIFVELTMIMQICIVRRKRALIHRAKIQTGEIAED